MRVVCTAIEEVAMVLPIGAAEWEEGELRPDVIGPKVNLSAACAER